MEREKKIGLFQELKTSALWILGFVILIWIVELANGVLGHRLNVLGIRPRTIQGLPGIILYPFLHSGFGHVLANTVPFIILGWLVILRGTRTFLQVSGFILVVSGVSIWFFGRTAYHIGASGVIFGYFGFLVARAWYERSMASVVNALVTIILYGGILWGVLPFHAHVAWDGHFFGLVAGVAGGPAPARRDRRYRESRLPRLDNEAIRVWDHWGGIQRGRRNLVYSHGMRRYCSLPGAGGPCLQP